MDRSKVIAIVTGVIALILSIAYLLVVQFLDLRGEMIPAPQDLSSHTELYLSSFLSSFLSSLIPHPSSFLS